MTYAGLSPKGPNDYVGPKLYGVTIVTRNREPGGADFRQPENGKLYPIGSYWIISIDPSSGVQGDLWYLSKIVANVAFWVKLSTGGSGPLIEVEVDAATAPGVQPVVPDVGGLMTILGDVVANHSVPIETHTRAVNAFNIEVQQAASAAATDGTKSGVAHFDSANFTVDANGFVSLSGGGQAIDSLGVQATSGSGTDPVLPDVTGKIEMEGALVAAGTNPLRAVSTAVNTVQYQVQTSQALAAADSTKTGVSNFRDTDFAVDANGFVTLTGNMVMTGVINIGFSYDGGTGVFTVHGQDGSALSASNPGFVTLQDPAALGQLFTTQVTANQSFIDDAGASEIIGNLFGLTTGIAITNDQPFFLYAVTNDAKNHIAFMISRYPNSPVSPVAAKIGMPSTPAADSQGSFFSIDNVTAADYENNPCLSIGSFRMKMSASDDWTVQTLASSDGIGHFQENREFLFPRGQFGAATGKVFYDNGGTAPDSTTGGYGYYVNAKNNRTFFTLAFPNTDVGGVGAVLARLALMYVRADGGGIGSGYNLVGGVYAILILDNGPTYALLNSVDPSASKAVENADFPAGATIALYGNYQIAFT